MMSTDRYLLQNNATVDYFTDVDNVKIFGYEQYCGDEVIDSGEECDGSVANTCEEYGVTCTTGFELTGEPICSNCTVNLSNCDCVQTFNIE